MDIVERLRRTELHHVWDDLEGKMVGKMFSVNPDGPEAADEIERLREEVKELEEIMEENKCAVGYLITKRVLKQHGMWKLKEDE